MLFRPERPLDAQFWRNIGISQPWPEFFANLICLRMPECLRVWYCLVTFLRLWPIGGKHFPTFSENILNIRECICHNWWTRKNHFWTCLIASSMLRPSSAKCSMARNVLDFCIGAEMWTQCMLRNLYGFCRSEALFWRPTQTACCSSEIRGDAIESQSGKSNEKKRSLKPKAVVDHLFYRLCLCRRRALRYAWRKSRKAFTSTFN